MIIDHEAMVVIATPSKCGTLTMKAMAKALPSDRMVEWVGMGVHRLDCPPEADGYTRLMMVRDPWARLVSMWSFIGKPSHYDEWEHDTIRRLTFTQFVDWYLERHEEEASKGPWEQRSARELWSVPTRWLMTLGECADVWKPEHTLDVASIEDSLFEHGLDYGKVRNANISHHRTGKWTDHYTPDTFKLVGDAFARADAKRFNFPGNGESITPDQLTGTHANILITQE